MEQANIFFLLSENPKYQLLKKENLTFIKNFFHLIIINNFVPQVNLFNFCFSNNAVNRIFKNYIYNSFILEIINSMIKLNNIDVFFNKNLERFLIVEKRKFNIRISRTDQPKHC